MNIKEIHTIGKPVLSISLFIKGEEGSVTALQILKDDYINIYPMVKHWLNGILNSQLLLIK